MSGNKQEMEYASLRRFICPPLQHGLSEMSLEDLSLHFFFFFVGTIQDFFQHLMSVVLKVRTSMSDAVRLTCSNFLSERRKKASGWEKNVLYPMVMLILLAGTVRVRAQLTSSLPLLLTGGHWDESPTSLVFLKRHGVETTSNSCLRQC